MKRLSRFIIPILVLIVGIVGFCFLFFVSTQRFRLSPEFIGVAGQPGEITHSSIAEIEDLAAEEKSFLVFVSQPDCVTAEDFRAVITEFLSNHPLKILEINFSDIRGHTLAPDLKFYPSFLIFHSGELAEFLRADSNTDVEAYSSRDAFEKWLAGYVYF